MDRSSLTSNLKAALAYAAERGWPVFPIPPGTKASYKRAKDYGGRNWGNTRDPVEIARDFTRWPRAGIGLACGAASGVFVLDVDTPEAHDGDAFASLAALEAEHGPVPPTLMARTASGGEHRFYEYPTDGGEIRNRHGKIAPGLDVKGEGGMVVLPPTRKGDGCYRWLNDLPIAPAPDWLLTLARKENHRGNGGDRPPIEFPDGDPAAAVDLEKLAFAMAALPNMSLDEVGGDTADPRYFDYDDWLAVLMACHRSFGGSPEGFRIFNAWSEKWSEKNKDKHDVAAKTWAGFGGDNPVREITARTVYHFAELAAPGWDAPYYAEAERRLEAANRDEEQHAMVLARLAGSPETDSTHAGAKPNSNTGDANTKNANDASAKPEPQVKPNGGAKPKVNPAAVSAKAVDLAANAASQVVLIRASDVAPRAKDWIWEGHLLRGALGLLTGLPGIGKSQVHCDFVARATTGRAWPNGAAAVAAMNVIMVTAEDSLDQELIPRLTAAGADLARVHIIKAIKYDRLLPGRQFLLGEDLLRLEGTIKRLGDVGLVTLDPITAYMGGKIDSHKTTEVRSQLGPLKDFAETNNVAVSAITHPAKNAGSIAINQFIGSQAFIAAARIGHFCCEEIGGGLSYDPQPDDDVQPTGRILFTNPKNNTTTKQPTLAYRIKETVIDSGGRGIAAPRVVWEAAAVDITADAAIAAARAVNNPRDRAGREARRFLKEFLAGGPKTEAEVMAAAVGPGRNYTAKQVRKAKEDLGVRSQKEEGTMSGMGPSVLIFGGPKWRCRYLNFARAPSKAP